MASKAAAPAGRAMVPLSPKVHQAFKDWSERSNVSVKDLQAEAITEFLDFITESVDAGDSVDFFVPPKVDLPTNVILPGPLYRKASRAAKSQSVAIRQLIFTGLMRFYRSRTPVRGQSVRQRRAS